MRTRVTPPGERTPTGQGRVSLRIAFYSHNGFGLGHITRNAKLAQALLRHRPNADILLITGSAGLNELPAIPNVDYVKLPSVRKQAAGRWRPQSLDIEMEHLLRLRRTMILETIRAYRPHLLVADSLPLGVERELRACARGAAQAWGRPGGDRLSRHPGRSCDDRRDLGPGRLARGAVRAVRPRARLRRSRLVRLRVVRPAVRVASLRRLSRRSDRGKEDTC